MYKFPQRLKLQGLKLCDALYIVMNNSLPLIFKFTNSSLEHVKDIHKYNKNFDHNWKYSNDV